jgi:hypothetical protein
MAKDFGDDLFSSSDRMSNGEMNKLDVVKMDYVYSESITWQELFSGFNSIKAITFSSGIGFVYQLLDMFKDAEIIFGCEEVMFIYASGDNGLSGEVDGAYPKDGFCVKREDDRACGARRCTAFCRAQKAVSRETLSA